jgi:hypothetical protein
MRRARSPRGALAGVVRAVYLKIVCDMLDRNPGKSVADLKNGLPKT